MAKFESGLVIKGFSAVITIQTTDVDSHSLAASHEESFKSAMDAIHDYARKVLEARISAIKVEKKR